LFFTLKPDTFTLNFIFTTFKVGGAINITNRLNASVASFPDPGIVTSFVAGIEGAKTIPPCLIVVSTEIQVRVLRW